MHVLQLSIAVANFVKRVSANVPNLWLSCYLSFQLVDFGIIWNTL